MAIDPGHDFFGTLRNKRNFPDGALMITPTSSSSTFKPGGVLVLLTIDPRGRLLTEPPAH